jgi:hypothetical protein
VLPHFCSNQISYSRVEGSASMPLVRERHAGRHGQQHECDEPADFQDADWRFMGSLPNKSHHTTHVTSMQRAIVGNSPLGTAELNAVIR